MLAANNKKKKSLCTYEKVLNHKSYVTNTEVLRLWGNGRYRITFTPFLSQILETFSSFYLELEWWKMRFYFCSNSFPLFLMCEYIFFFLVYYTVPTETENFPLSFWNSKANNWSVHLRKFIFRISLSKPLSFEDSGFPPLFLL